ncbi:MAG: DUF4446 family protein [Candidatus Doudnabacteria bacterium]|nr:DUF4446 family protein [Candidatus Doudnabacteria bacterium]
MIYNADMNQSMNNTDITYIFFALSVALFFAVTWLTIKLVRMERLRKEFYASGLKKDLEQILIEQNRALKKINDELEEHDQRLSELDKNNQNNFQKIGFVRFNPFDNSGGNVSFALALLNAYDDGFVISSLHGREGTRVYSKTVKKGKSESQLTDEEQQAIKTAK